jgi:hypothetical protein
MVMNNKQVNAVTLKENIITAVQESCETTTSTIFKVLDAVRNIKYETTEPGVELVDSLKTIIKVSIENAVEHGCDIGVVIKGIIVGAFRSSDSVRQEAHKTIDHLVQLILKDSIQAGADPKASTEAIIKGILEIVREEKLNVGEALSEAGTSAVLATYTLNSRVESLVREALSKDFSSHKVELKEDFLKIKKKERIS